MKKTIRSNSKKAKSIIRSEIRTYFKPKEYGTRSSVNAMRKDANAYNAGSNKKYLSDYTKGAALVDAGGLACYYNDQKKMLRKIYGNKVNSWNGNKTHSTYKHLIGREYSAMLRENRKKH